MREIRRGNARVGWLLLLFTAAACAQDSPATVNGDALAPAAVTGPLEQRYGYLFLETAILSRLILQAAADAGLTPTDAEIEIELDRFYQTHFAYSDRRLARWRGEFGRTEPGLRDEVEVQLAQRKLRSRGVTVDEPTLRQFFEANREQYRRPESIVFRQILVPNPTGETDAAKRAQQILREIQGGLPFEEAARVYSEDPNAALTGGVVGPTPLANLRAVRATTLEALAPLQPGQVAAEPLLVNDRYVLLQLVERLPAVEPEFEPLATRVETDYLIARMQPQGEFFRDLLQNADIRITDPRYPDLRPSGRWISPNGLALPGWLREDF